MDQVQRWADHTGRKTIPVRYQGTGTIASGGLFDTLTHWDVRCTYSDGLELHMVDNESYRRYTEAPHPEMPWGTRRRDERAQRRGVCGQRGLDHHLL